jgi:hypothetical protein
MNPAPFVHSALAMTRRLKRREPVPHSPGSWMTKRTCRGRLTMSAPEGETDVPREPGHFCF